MIEIAAAQPALKITDAQIQRIKRLARIERMKNEAEKIEIHGIHNSPNKKMVMEYLEQLGWKGKEGFGKKTRISRKILEARETRILLVRFMVEKVLKKDPKEVSRKDFEECGLVGLLERYGGGPFLALKDAGLVYSEAEMARAPRNYLKRMRLAKHEK